MFPLPTQSYFHKAKRKRRTPREIEESLAHKAEELAEEAARTKICMVEAKADINLLLQVLRREMLSNKDSSLWQVMPNEEGPASYNRFFLLEHGAGPV